MVEPSEPPANASSASAVSATSALPEPKSNYRWYALAMLTTVYIVNFVDRQILSILLSDIKAAFDVSDTYLGFLSGISFALFYATLGIPIAMWADRGNRRNIITLALTVFSVMTALCGFAANFVQLALARIGVGVGEAGASPPSHSIIADLFPPKERATAMGIFAVGVNIGIMIGFFAGGWIRDVYGWRIAFMAVGAPGLVVALFVRIFLKEPVRGASDKSQDRRFRGTFVLECSTDLPAHSGAAPHRPGCGSQFFRRLWRHHLAAFVSRPLLFDAP